MHTRPLTSRGAIAALAIAVASACSVPAHSSGEKSAETLCERPFTVCVWPGAASDQADDTAGRRKFKRFLRLVADLSKTVKLRYARAPIKPASMRCDKTLTGDAQMDLVIDALYGDAPAPAAAELITRAAGEDGDTIEDGDAPGCGIAFSFSIDTEFRSGSPACGFDILVADSGWPTDAASAAVYRPVDWNGDTVVIGERATVRLRPSPAGVAKPVAWVQLIAVGAVGEEAGNAYGTISLLTDAVEFEIEKPLTIRIGCGTAEVMTRGLNRHPTFNSKTVTGFLDRLAGGKKAIGPEIHPIDLDSLNGAGDGAKETEVACTAKQCGTLRIAFEPESPQ